MGRGFRQLRPRGTGLCGGAGGRVSCARAGQGQSRASLARLLPARREQEAWLAQPRRACLDGPGASSGAQVCSGQLRTGTRAAERGQACWRGGPGLTLDRAPHPPGLRVSWGGHPELLPLHVCVALRPGLAVPSVCGHGKAAPAQHPGSCPPRALPTPIPCSDRHWPGLDLAILPGLAGSVRGGLRPPRSLECGRRVPPQKSCGWAIVVPLPGLQPPLDPGLSVQPAPFRPEGLCGAARAGPWPSRCSLALPSSPRAAGTLSERTAASTLTGRCGRTRAGTAVCSPTWPAPSTGTRSCSCRVSPGPRSWWTGGAPGQLDLDTAPSGSHAPRSLRSRGGHARHSMAPQLRTAGTSWHASFDTSYTRVLHRAVPCPQGTASGTPRRSPNLRSPRSLHRMAVFT